ncbi:collagen-like protein [Streptomyces sp. NPDC058240]|uniref:collagen-like protein n=1 Tax=Streptomyces sp. NPDC058240 TaxID=3346396 RepID=UPI0036ED66D6
MHRRPDVLVRQWRTFALAAVLLVLSGAVLLVWLRIGAADRRADDLAAEADRRGSAVSTLAGDVRVLRAQIKAKGETPAAPDPGRAVANLPDRAQVPVPIPGPAGPPGAAGATVTGPPGPAGADGKDGADGADGRDGTDGQTCPDGYSLRPPPGDPDGLMCRRDTPSSPDPSPSPTVAGLPADRRRS